MLRALVCDREVLLKRVQSETRSAYGKLTDPLVMADLLDRFDYATPLPFEPTLLIDSTHLAPTEVAAQIVKHYDLPLVAAE